MTARGIQFPVPHQPAGAAQLRQEVRDFLAQEDFEPRCDAWLGGFDPEFSRRLAASGWVGMTWPKRYGGHERSSLDRHVVIEELLAAGAPVAAHWVSDRHFNQVVLRDAFVPEDMLVGEEGAGWRQVVSELAFERSGPERLLSTYPLFAELLCTLADPHRPGSRTGGTPGCTLAVAAPAVAQRRERRRGR